MEMILLDAFGAHVPLSQREPHELMLGELRNLKAQLEWALEMIEP